MPEPKKSKRSFEAITDTSLDSLHLVQRNAQPENGEQGSARAGGKARAGKKPPEEPELVEKLIAFIKNI
jgi:hypothetical protein